MTYDSNLAESQQESLPEVYQFEWGGTIERFTSWPENITFLGNVFETAPIKRSGLNIDHEFSAVKMTINAPIIDAFARYIANTPIEATRVTVYRGLLSDMSDYIILFAGRVLNVSVKDLQAQASCESNTDILTFAYPRFMYQAYCNHEVFDSECGLDENIWKVSATVTISGADLISATFGGFSNGYFTNGRVIAGSDQRLITNHVTTTITLQVPFDDRVSDGDTVIVLPGCDGAASTCQNKFSNFTKFLGFPYIPSKNPVVWGIK